MEKESLGKRLQNLRCEKGLTQLQLANALNIDKSTVAKYEIDKIEPSLSMFKILVHFFEVSADYLLGLED